MAEIRSCVVCLSQCSSKKGRSNNVINGGSLLPQVINNDLNVIFVLKNVLEIPNDNLENLLKKHGSPNEWGIHVCESCTESYLERAHVLHDQAMMVQKQFQSLRTQVKEHLSTSKIDEENGAVGQAVAKGKGKRKAQGPGPVFVEVRKWVLDHSDPKIKEDINAVIEAAGGIDAYVAQKTASANFSKLGPGRKLTDENQPGPSSAVLQNGLVTKFEAVAVSSGTSVELSDKEAAKTRLDNVSEEKKAAAAAALARFQKAKKPEADSKEFLASRQAAFIKEQVKKELEAEKVEDSAGDKETNNNHKEPIEIPERVIDPASYAVKGVYFGSSLLGCKLMSKMEIEDKIREYLAKQLQQEENEDLLTTETAALIIHSCNKPQEMVTACVETLSKLLDNIIHNPTENKYRQIRCSNRPFQKVSCVFGAEQFLKAVGFVKQLMPNLDTWCEVEEEYWHLDPEDGSIANLIEFRDLLKATKPIKPELDRNVQVLRPEQVASRAELPDEFYVLSPGEIKNEQKLKTDLIERETTLRTKAMREQDAIGERRLYRYGVIRVRFPDSTILQGTFCAYEKISSLFQFVRNSLNHSDLKFDLVQPGGETITENNGDSTLTDFKLPPSSILIFSLENTPTLLATGELSYLKPRLYRQIENN